MKLLMDENMPRRVETELARNGHDVLDVRDVGLRGAEDRDIFRYAVDRDRVLVTRDLDFANVITYPLGHHPGIVVLRLPDSTPASRVAAITVAAMRSHLLDEIRGALAIIEPGRIRLRTADSGQP